MKHFAKGWIFGLLLSGVVIIGAAVNATAYTVVEYGNGGFLDIDYQVQARAARSDIGAPGTGDNSTTNYYLYRDRLSFLGMVNETFGYALQLEYVGGQTILPTQVIPREQANDYELSALDYYVTASFADAFNIRAGREKHQLTREVNEGCFQPLSVDRSLFILGPFGNGDKTTRDNGVVFWGNLFNDVFQYRAAVMVGNNYADQKPDNSGYRYTGRVHITLLDPESGLGYRGSYLGKKKVLTFGAGYEMEPNAVYSSFTGGVGSGSENYKAYTYDGFFEYPTDLGTVTLSGAYLKADFNNAGTRGVPGAADLYGEKNGGYWKAAYMIGKFQVYGRLENWAFASLNGVQDQHVDWRAAGVNYYIKGQDLRLTLEQEKIAFNKLPSRDFETTVFQLQARF
jgi:hypothetical protein